ncbi:5035_t:CDS:2, partial [Ambispora gerdemannii]
IKLFSVSPHAANCERVWLICGWIYGTRRTRLSIGNLDVVAQIHSYYIANNKAKLPYYGVDLYEEVDDITFEQSMMNANINQSSIDDDDEFISEETFELEESLDLSNLQFLPVTEQNDVEDDNTSEIESNELADYLAELDQENDYDLAELGEMFFS